MKLNIAKWREHRRFLTVILLLIIVFCYAMFQGGFVSWFLFFAVVPFLLYAALLSVVPIRFEQATRQINPQYAERNQHVEVTIHFKNRSKFPLLFAVIKEQHLPKECLAYLTYIPSKVMLIGWKRDISWSYTLHSMPRGEHELSAVELTISDFFGWVQRRVIVEAPHTLRVFPKVVAMKQVALPMQYEQGVAARNYSLLKDTSIATGVREYQAGDRFSWIHWKSFAKNGALKTKEFEDRQAQQVTIILDQGEQPHFEYSVDLAASMAKSLMKADSELAFYTTAPVATQFPIVKTVPQYERLLHALITVVPQQGYSAIAKLSGLQSARGSIVLLVTSHVNDDVLAVLRSGQKYAKAIICFVVVEKEQKKSMPAFLQGSGENRLVYITPELLAEAFSEVGK